MDEAKEQVKLVKAKFNIATAEIQSVVSRGVDYRTKPVPKLAPAKAPKDTKPESPKGDQPATAAPAPNTSEDWRSIETKTILDGIEGLGKKKREDLLESFPTLGKLEDARAEASKEFVLFQKKLPKGIGESIATELENRMLKAVLPNATTE